MRTFQLTILLCSLNFSQLAGDEWPQWRGTNLNSLSAEQDLPDSFAEKYRLWRYELPGPGGASPIVWGDQIFVASVEGNGLALLCITTDGKLQWKKELAGENTNIRMDRSNTASPSPVTDGKHVWVMLSDGILHCFTTDGKLVWKKDMQEAFGKFKIQFGMTSTPLLDNGRLYFQFIHGDMRARKGSTGQIVALNASDGKKVWVHVRHTDATVENKHAYTSPTIHRNGKREFLIVHGADFATGHALDDGSELWRMGGMNPKSNYNPLLRFVSSPVSSKSLIVIPSAKGGPVFGISPDVSGTVGEDSESVKWKLDRGTPDVATPVISASRVYLARENGVLICIDADSGKKLFEERVLSSKHRSTPIVADGKVFAVARNGKAVVIADKNEFKLISEHDLEEDTTASPAVSNGRIYIRTNKSLIAFGRK